MRFLQTRQCHGPRLTALFLALAAGTACGARGDAPRLETAAADPAGSSTAATPPVRAGIQVLLTDSIHLVRGKRVGLITNQTGVVASDSAGGALRSTIDLLHDAPGVTLAALFGPEHSIRGNAAPGEQVSGGVDPRTGVPVYSLYGSTLKPTPEMLAGIDVLLFDIQDIGTRYYTYMSTMALAMEAAGKAGIPFVVLDRPDPIGGEKVQGNVLDPAFSSFIGEFPVAMRYGMTPGELARLYVGQFGVKVELHVVPAAGWTRGMPFAETGLPWVPPSPNMPSLESALHYPGTCLFEGTNLSVGRGTDRPFQEIGAPWLDGAELARRLNAYGLADVRFEAVRFTPEKPGDGKYDGVPVSGVRFVATGSRYDPTRAAVAALVEARRMAGERWRWNVRHFDQLAGTDRLRQGIERGLGLDSLTSGWAAQDRRFEKLRAPYLIYPRASTPARKAS